MAGDPEHVAGVLTSLNNAYSPDSIGLALVGGADQSVMMRDAIATFEHLAKR